MANIIVHPRKSRSVHNFKHLLAKAARKRVILLQHYVSILQNKAPTDPRHGNNTKNYTLNYVHYRYYLWSRCSEIRRRTRARGPPSSWCCLPAPWRATPGHPGPCRRAGSRRCRGRWCQRCGLHEWRRRERGGREEVRLTTIEKRLCYVSLQ